MEIRVPYLLKISKTVYLPIDHILLIVDYTNPFAIKKVTESGKEGAVWNVSVKEVNTKKLVKTSTKCVIFLMDGRLLTTETSTATLIKRYEESLKEAALDTSSYHLVKLSKSAYMPANRAVLIVDYSNPFAIQHVREKKKEGQVWNLATTEKQKKRPDLSGAGTEDRKRAKRPAVNCVLLLSNGKTAVVATSTATIVKRYEDAVRGEVSDLDSG